MRIPPKPTFELLFGYFIFSGISGFARAVITPECGEQMRVRPLSREFRDFRSSRHSSSEKNLFAMTLGSLPKRMSGCLTAAFDGVRSLSLGLAAKFAEMACKDTCRIVAKPGRSRSSRCHRYRNLREEHHIAKGFCRAKFWAAKFPFWTGAVRGEVCGEFFAKFSGWFGWDIQRKNISKNFSSKFP